MEKMFWTTIAVLWAALLSGSALGDTRSLTQCDQSLRGQSLTAEFDHAVASPAANVSLPAVAALPTARVVSMDPTRGPIVAIGNGGGTELLGGAIAGGLLLRYARRRRLI